jgi:cysteinyl-tRNA synthetase
MADLLRRWLENGHGFTVCHVKNITDVGHLVHDADHGDDKVQTQAEREKLHPLEIARRYEAEFIDDENMLNILPPHHRPRASEYIKEQLAMIRTLLARGNAYETDDGIYFDVTSPLPTPYGTLSGNLLGRTEAGARVDVNEKKKHPADFALWKKCVGDNARHVLRWSFEHGEGSSSSGDDPSSGFPGWHIECSAMSSSLLGEQIDLHTGGEDNIFPHHECEIAQSEAASQKKPFVICWLHKRRIDLAGAKMSKSLGNVLLVPAIVERGYSPLDLRYYLLSVHYRTNLKFTWKGMDDARGARRSIVEWMKRGGAGEYAPTGKHPPSISADDVATFEKEFRDAMDGDLNTSGALAAVFSCIHKTNTSLLPDAPAKAALTSFITLVRQTFGCFEPEIETVPADVQSLVDQREAARKAKDFAASDRLRGEIEEKGWIVKDTKEGQKVTRK